MPINGDLHDLQAPARQPNPTPAARLYPEDQIGRLSAATVLDSWVRDWRDTLWAGHHLPPATVDQLTAWLRTRLPDACDTHPAIDAFATELRDLRNALRSAAGVTEAKPERCDGVPCKRCDLMTLFRQSDGDVHCANPDCQTVLRGDEYDEWVKTIAAAHAMKGRMARNAAA